MIIKVYKNKIIYINYFKCGKCQLNYPNSYAYINCIINEK